MGKGDKILNYVAAVLLGLCIIFFVCLFTSCTPMPAAQAAPVAATGTPSPTAQPSPSPSPSPAPSCADVTAAQSLHVRSGPGTDNPVIGYLAHGERVRIIQYDQAGNFPDLSLSQWWEIRTAQGLTGWARSTFLNQTICEPGE